MDAVRVLGGRYRLVERLGEGGMSVVWRAHDQVLDRQVAVKVLASGQVDPAACARVRAEAQAAARLAHPHITGVHDYGETRDEAGQVVPYVVLELVRGPTLSDRLRAGPLPVQTALVLAAQIASALAAAHARGLVHQDVKPDNVLLAPSGAKVTDFGIAAVIGEAVDSPDEVRWGTPAYLAPERLTTGEVLPASDVYALGLLLYRLLTGRAPWHAETVTAMLRAHQYAEPEPLPAIEGVPESVATVCQRCLAKRPEDRPSAGEVVRVLGEALGADLTGAGVALGPDHEPGDEPDTQLVPRAAGVMVLAGAAVPPGAVELGGAAGGDPPVHRRRLVLVSFASVLVTVAVALLATFCVPVDRQRDGLARSPLVNTSLGAQPEAAQSAQPEAAQSAEPEAAQSAEPGAAQGAQPGTSHTGAPGSGTGGGPGSGGNSEPGGNTGPGGSGSGGSGPGGGPSGGRPPTTAPAPVEGGADTPGGSAICRCTGSTAYLVSYQPLPGFQPTRIERGPAPTVGVVFDGLVLDIGLSFRCVNGTPVASIQTL